MKNQMTHYTKTVLMVAVSVAVALLAGYWAATAFEPRILPWEPRPFPGDRIRGDLELFYIIQTVISSVDATLLVFLFAAYIGIYRKTQSEFTVGLMVLSMVLLLYALTSNPLIQSVFGFRAVGLGPFAMLPDLFSLIASTVLLYLTIKY